MAASLGYICGVTPGSEGESTDVEQHEACWEIQLAKEVFGRCSWTSRTIWLSCQEGWRKVKVPRKECQMRLSRFDDPFKPLNIRHPYLHFELAAWQQSDLNRSGGWATWGQERWEMMARYQGLDTKLWRNFPYLPKLSCLPPPTYGKLYIFRSSPLRKPQL